MHPSTPLLILAIAAGCVLASHSHYDPFNHFRHTQHSRLSRRHSRRNGRCANHTMSTKTSTHASTATVHSVGSSTDPGQSNLRANNQLVSNLPNVINIQSQCGPTGATPNVTATTGPNGSIDWLNCGINDGGWQPPYMTVADIITRNLSEALQEPGSPFALCEPYIAMFEQYASQFGVPPTLVAAIALQESTCNEHTVGGAGEQGLMQLTQDKCGSAPGGNCRDPAYNIRTGVQYFSVTLKNNGGSLLLTLGNYNGWPSGLTFGQATAAANTACCRCQNNLDYLHQTLNGWCQNINPYTSHLGKYWNLDQCDKP